MKYIWEIPDDGFCRGRVKADWKGRTLLEELVRCTEELISSERKEGFLLGSVRSNIVSMS